MAYCSLGCVVGSLGSTAEACSRAVAQECSGDELQYNQGCMSLPRRAVGLVVGLGIQAEIVTSED